jgi:hypothetical protein
MTDDMNDHWLRIKGERIIELERERDAFVNLLICPVSVTGGYDGAYWGPDPGNSTVRCRYPERHLAVRAAYMAAGLYERRDPESVRDRKVFADALASLCTEPPPSELIDRWFNLEVRESGLRQWATDHARIPGSNGLGILKAAETLAQSSG